MNERINRTKNMDAILISRKKILKDLSLLGLILASWVYNVSAQSIDSISVAFDLVDLTFSKAEFDSMKSALNTQKEAFKEIRKMSFPNDMPYSMTFIPPINKEKIPKKQSKIKWVLEKGVDLPANKSELAFYPVHKLASLIKSKKISSVELTLLFLDRLKRYGDTLECVISITDSLALAQAKRADEEISHGKYRGPLHGIPYGLKDLLAVSGYKTTWGAIPYKDQYLSYDATVVEKLDKAGAVLLAKLSMGALAWGDVWYGGKTKNPWNLSQGSGGSSSGPASATVAGLVPFSIGSETLGSIVEPATRCGATGLRPTFGRVSRHGAMVLNWSMDKLGPICRSAIDCALVFDVIRGEDGLDSSVRDFPFNYNYSNNIKKLRIGILVDEFKSTRLNHYNDSTIIEFIKREGFSWVNKSFPFDFPTQELSFISDAEAGAAFDELTRSKRDTLMVSQMLWPNTLRASRLIPAVEYIQANRIRYQLILEFNEMIKDIDVLLAPSLGPSNLITNLTGHPCVVLPDGNYAGEHPGTITLIGNHFDEASILLLARFIQEITPFENQHPANFYK